MDELFAALGLEAVGAPAREGRAVRQIATRGQDTVVLYHWGDLDDAAYAHKIFSSSQLGEQLFAVPDVLDVDLDAGWVMLRAPEGVPLVDWLDEQGLDGLHQLDPYKHRALVESLGVLVRKLHSLEAPGVFGKLGVFDPDSSYLPPGVYHTFNGWVAERLERDGEALGGLSALDEEQRLMLKEHLGDLRHELSAFHPRHPAVVTHGALGRDHLWISRTGQEIVGLTGFEHARYLPAEADNAHLLWIEGLAQNEALIRAFYQGYGAARTMDVQRRERFYRRLVAFDVLCADRTSHLHGPRDLLRLAGPAIV